MRTPSRRALATWRKLGRPVDGRLLGGVCVAIAERLAIHVWLVRVAFVILALADGLGLLLYGLAWVLLPSEGEEVDAASLRRAASSRLAGLSGEVSRLGSSARQAWQRGGRRDWPRPLSRRWIGLCLVAVGALVLMASFGAFDWLTPVRALGLAVAAIGAAVLMTVYGDS